MKGALSGLMLKPPGRSNLQKKKDIKISKRLPIAARFKKQMR
jgi:hypothetical protein